MPAAKKKKVESPKAKGDVIHIRTAPQDKSLIEQVAEKLGLSVSSFMLENALKAARRELAEMERTELSRKDAQRFAAALLSPPAPNAALRAAFKDYSRQLRK